MPITLWSGLKMYRRMNPWAPVPMHGLRLGLCHPLPPPAVAASLCRGHALQPFLEILFGHHLKNRPHIVVAQAAQLGADDFVPACLRRREMDWDIHAGNQVLLQAQFANKEGMGDVFGAKNQLHRMIDRDRQVAVTMSSLASGSCSRSRPR